MNSKLISFQTLGLEGRTPNSSEISNFSNVAGASAEVKPINPTKATSMFSAQTVRHSKRGYHTIVNRTNELHVKEFSFDPVLQLNRNELVLVGDTEEEMWRSSFSCFWQIQVLPLLKFRLGWLLGVGMQSSCGNWGSTLRGC